MPPLDRAAARGYVRGLLVGVGVTTLCFALLDWRISVVVVLVGVAGRPPLWPARWWFA